MEQTPQVIELEKVRLELRNGQLRITPKKRHPGSAVIIDPKRLERWVAKVYRDGVLES